MSRDPEIKLGVANAIAAYMMWGVAPLYFKALQGIAAPDILVHRIIWSLVLVGLLVVLRKKLGTLIQLFCDPKTLKFLLVSGILLAFNWLLFIYAVNSDQILEASLGYYINPLFSVLLGFVFLQERFRRGQKIAVVLAFVGVCIQIVALGTLPWIALGLAFSFGIYGLLRKKVQVDSLVGLLLETILMVPFALAYWIWFSTSDQMNMFTNDIETNSLLIAAGIVTTAPLLCFTAAAKRLRLSTMGFFQYIGPSMMFIIAVSLFDEAFSVPKMVTFGFIWTALVIYSLDSIRASRKSAKTNL